jgi:hypothetical protein
MGMEDGFSATRKKKPQTKATPVVVSHTPVLYRHPLRREMRSLVKRALYQFLLDQSQSSGVLDFGQKHGGINQAVSEQFVFSELDKDGKETRKYRFSIHQIRLLIIELRKEGMVKTYRKGEFYLSWVVEGCDQVAIDELIAAREATMADPDKLYILTKNVTLN